MAWHLHWPDVCSCSVLAVIVIFFHAQACCLDVTQVGSYQAAPLDMPELRDLEPLLLYLPGQPASNLQRCSGRSAQALQARPYQELHCLHALLRLQQALEGLRQCQEQLQAAAEGTEQQQQAALTAAYAAVRGPVLELLLEGLAPAAMQLPLLVYLVPVLDSLFSPFTRDDVTGLMQVLNTAAGPMPAAAAVLAGTGAAQLGLGWPAVASDEGAAAGAGGKQLHARHLNDVRLALCRGLARSHVAESV